MDELLFGESGGEDAETVRAPEDTLTVEGALQEAEQLIQAEEEKKRSPKKGKKGGAATDSLATDDVAPPKKQKVTKTSLKGRDCVPTALFDMDYERIAIEVGLGKLQLF